MLVIFPATNKLLIRGLILNEEKGIYSHGYFDRYDASVDFCLDAVRGILHAVIIQHEHPADIGSA